MTALYILIPVAMVLVLAAIGIFIWAVDTGQYDDLDGPAHSILFDDEDPAHLKARAEVQESQDSKTKPAHDEPES
ncbi:MAG: cbb3-type cytochrome oxidase maturation protein [Halopseudomonas sp.]|jgi:cbb3-type cytochrome oxidase maturation protein|uniref:cbb3-type cytochrome oxidase assembly protein CcoS n=1 Tax=Halopseudomonas sp. TaxID=2901191 RepID=UPI0039E57030